MHCRFENRLAHKALVLNDFMYRLDAWKPADLEPVLQQIEAAGAQGCWTALLLDYELGEWLEPGVLETRRALTDGYAARPGSPASTPENGNPDPAHNRRPRLTALVFRQAQHELPWGPVSDIASPALHWAPRIDRTTYRTHIEHLRQGIARGDYYQVNYTFPIDIQTRLPADHLYRHIACRHPSAHAAFIQVDAGPDTPERTLLSFSPELFVERTGTRLTVRPMKGTAPRHPDPEQDQALGQALRASPKNRAENVMIVDLLRNDLGRIATPGSVQVPALFDLEAYPSVWTLTSTITAEAPGTSLFELLQALFPCGSITGAPKIAAMQAIRQLEPYERGIYCGSIGWIAPSGDFSLNVAIRTLEMDGPGQGRFSVGGGIVYDSDPDQEWDECLWKARLLNS